MSKHFYSIGTLCLIMWQAIKEATIPELKNPILLEGLPGIGNVGKIAIDFVIEELKAKKIYSLFSYTFPHSVFVNHDDLVELPSIEMYYKKGRNTQIFYTNLPYFSMQKQDGQILF